MTAVNRKLKQKNFKENISKNLKKNYNFLDLSQSILWLFGVPYTKLPQCLIHYSH